MQLTQQEILFLDRVAAHMIASGEADIDTACRAVCKRDQELLLALTTNRQPDESRGVINAVAARVYVKLGGKPLHKKTQKVTELTGWERLDMNNCWQFAGW